MPAARSTKRPSDAENVRWLGDAADLLGEMMDAAIRAHDGKAAKITREDPAVDPEAEEQEEDVGPKLVAERLYVELGLVDEDWAQVAEGVTKGDTVIVVGQSHLRDGGRVRVASAEAPEGAEASAATPEGDEG